MRQKKEGSQVIYKVAILGAPKSGKSTLLNALSKENFSIDPPDSNEKTLMFTENQGVQLAFWDDSPKNDRDLRMSDFSRPETHAYIMTLDPTVNTGIDDFEKQMESLKHNCFNLNAPIIVIDTKADIPNKAVEQSEINDVIKKWKKADLTILHFGHFSARKRNDVEKLFDFIHENIVKKLIQTEKSEEKCLEEFRIAHRNDLVNDKFPLAKSKSQIKYTETLKEVIRHAQKKGNRSRKICVDLGWMENDGTITQDAPQAVKDVAQVITKGNEYRF